jgi:hypothetical protein
MKNALIIFGITAGVFLLIPAVFIALPVLYPEINRVYLKEGYLEPTGQMVYPRIGPEAVLLANGTVLMCGGEFQRRQTVPFEHQVDPPCEIYNPETGQFVLTGAMLRRRRSYSLIALPSGEALVVGGKHQNTNTKMLEIYDPVTGSFSEGPSIQVERNRPTLTLLQDGKVLISGGGTVELYDPLQETIKTIGKSSQGVSGRTAIVLKSGNVLFLGRLPEESR